MDGYDSGVIYEWVSCPPVHAELVTSQLRRESGAELHAPILDIDHAVTVVESSPGKHHVYIDVPMTWRQYRRLLKALARAGVIEKDWAAMSIRRGWSSVRVPWLKKKDATYSTSYSDMQG